MLSAARTVDAYLASLPDDRRAALGAVRAEILRSLPKGYEEGMQYGMIGYYVPHSQYPAGYHCNPKEPLPFVGLGSQKGYMSLYLMCVYADTDLLSWFVEEYRKSGKKLDMGKSCVRFKRLDDVPLELIGRAVGRVPMAEYIAHCEENIVASKRSRAEASVKAKTGAAGTVAAKAGTKSKAKGKSA